MDRKNVALARLIAKQEIVTEIKRRGEKPSHYSVKELIELADRYVRLHRETIWREVVMQRWMQRFEPMREPGKKGHPNRSSESPIRSRFLKLALMWI